jgi:hypothetical protein
LEVAEGGEASRKTHLSVSAQAGVFVSIFGKRSIVFDLKSKYIHK